MESNSGILIINKPAGITSHDVVDGIRKVTGIRKVGHAGTLDPMATGVLLILVDKATKLSNSLLGLDKKYRATLKLGCVSDSYDKDGKVEEHNTEIVPTEEEIKKVIKKFTGTIDQIPPMYSAKKVGGRKLYQLARQGKEIERQAKKITVYSIKLIDYQHPLLTIEVECSTGTYIRSLAHDIGQELKTGAYLEELERLTVGDHKIKQAIDLKQLTSDNWQGFLIKKWLEP